MVRLLLKELPDEQRREYCRHPEFGGLVQQALLTEDQLSDDELLTCLPEILREPGPMAADAAPELLLRVQRFSRLPGLGGADLRQAAEGLLEGGWSPEQAARSGHWDAILGAARLAEAPVLIEALVQAAVSDCAAINTERWSDPRRYELVDLLVGNVETTEQQIRHLLGRLHLGHVQEIKESVRQNGRLHRLCAQALEARSTKPSRASSLTLPTDEELSAAADPQSILRSLMSHRAGHRDAVVDHVLASRHMTDDLAWRLPVQDLERHPVYGPRLAAEIAAACGESPARWQAFSQAWIRPSSLLAATLFTRLRVQA